MKERNTEEEKREDLHSFQKDSFYFFVLYLFLALYGLEVKYIILEKGSKMEKIIENQNTQLRKDIQNLDLDMSHVDFSDIEYLISPNFITRGSVYKNNSFDKKKDDKFIDSFIEDANKG